MARSSDDLSFLGLDAVISCSSYVLHGIFIGNKRFLASFTAQSVDCNGSDCAHTLAFEGVTHYPCTLGTALLKRYKRSGPLPALP